MTTVVAANNAKEVAEIKERIVKAIHDIRTPLSNIKLNIDLIALKPEETEKYLEVLRSQTERTIEIINDLRSIAN